MNNLPVWLQLIILIGTSGIFSSFVTLILSPIVAQQQMKQLETTYLHKLNDNLLENAKQYKETLYIPLNKALSKIDECYHAYKAKKGHLQSLIKNETIVLGQLSEDEKMTKIKELISPYKAVTEEAVMDFFSACNNFTLLMTKFVQDGNDTHLPMELDDHLRSFSRRFVVIGRVNAQIVIDMKGIETVLEIDTNSFEESFLADMRYLRLYIKSITQGTAIANSSHTKKTSYHPQVIALKRYHFNASPPSSLLNYTIDRIEFYPIRSHSQSPRCTFSTVLELYTEDDEEPTQYDIVLHALHFV